MKTFREILDAASSKVQLAKDMGVEIGAVGMWYTRNYVPGQYWQSLIDAMKLRKVRGVTAKRVVEIGAKK